MTVGVAAKTVQGPTIVLMTDRQFGIGENELKTEEPIGKVFSAANAWVAAYAGDPTFAEAVIAWAGTRWNEIPEPERPTFQIGMMKHFHEAYLDQFEDAVGRNVLRPRLLDKRIWRDRIVKTGFDPALRSEIETEFVTYERDHGCELLLCGFDPRGDPHIVTVGLREQQHEHEWAAIGSGANIARGRLVWQKTHRYGSLARTVYEVFEAASHASMNPSVGENIDAVLLLKGRAEDVPPEMMELMRSVVRYQSQTPFTNSRRYEDKAVDPPPNDWQARLMTWADEIAPYPDGAGEQAP